MTETVGDSIIFDVIPIDNYKNKSNIYMWYVSINLKPRRKILKNR